MTVEEKVQLIVEDCRKKLMEVVGKPVTLILFGDQQETLSYEDIAQAVCEAMELPYPALLKKSRKGEVVVSRQLIFFYAKRYTKLSHGSIADRLGYKEHSTSIHSIQKIKDLIDARDWLVLNAISKINKQLNIIT